MAWPKQLQRCVVNLKGVKETDFQRTNSLDFPESKTKKRESSEGFVYIDRLVGISARYR
jgi:hypothetical protein